MPNDTIKRAVKRGTGEIEGAAYEEVLYEGTGPAGTLFLVEGMTDNRNRTVAEIRKIFEKNNGVLGGAGTARLGLRSQGHHPAREDGATEDQLMEVAVGAGAEDYTRRGRRVARRRRHPRRSTSCSKALEAASIAVKVEQLGYVPKNKKPVAGRDAEVCLNLAEALDDHDDVQNVYADFDISDEEIASQAIAAASGIAWRSCKPARGLQSAETGRSPRTT